MGILSLPEICKQTLGFSSSDRKMDFYLTAIVTAYFSMFSYHLDTLVEE
jgi:hypothetical protein